MDLKRVHFEVLSLILVFGFSFAAKWNYIPGDENGPENWEKISETCGGNRQSPIDIMTGDLQYEPSLGEFTFSNYDTAQKDVQFEITNNGHTVGVNLRTTNQVQIPIELSGGGLNGTYVLAQFHFHWGEDDSHGSEHHTDSIKYAAELHLVHYKKAYGNVSESLNYGDGLAVLGVHMKVGGDDAHSGFTGFTEYLKNVTYEGNTTTIDEYPITRMLPENKKNYYRYLGSLTTPTCDEAVVWTVFEDSITISHDQMAEFRKVRDEDDKPINNNYRKPQPANNRTIYSSFEMLSPSEKPDPSGQNNLQSVKMMIVLSTFIGSVTGIL